MKVGDLVKPVNAGENRMLHPFDDDDWVGIIISFTGTDPVVYWDERFPAEVEYGSQLRVISPREKENI